MNAPVDALRFGSGKAIQRVEDPALVTGRGRFTDDENLPGQTHLVFVRSPHCHARILSIDTESARGMPQSSSKSRSDSRPCTSTVVGIPDARIASLAMGGSSATPTSTTRSNGRVPRLAARKPARRAACRSMNPQLRSSVSRAVWAFAAASQRSCANPGPNRSAAAPTSRMVSPAAASWSSQ